MNKSGKILISVALITFLFLFIANVSAADLVVNKNTTHSDIDSWMKNSSTVKGNNLIFNTSKYDLTDSINISKPINIKSNVKTQINFNKNKNMLIASTSGINFSGLTLNHYGKGSEKLTFSAIYSNDSSKTVNIYNMNFILNNDFLNAVFIRNWKGNISDSNVISKGKCNYGFGSYNFLGNVYGSSILMEKEESCGIAIFEKFIGNISNFNFKSNERNTCMIFAKNWIGNVYKSKISLFKFSDAISIDNWVGNFSHSKISFINSGLGITAVNWTGNFFKSNITSKNYGIGVSVFKWVGKVSNSIINIKGRNSSGFLVNSLSKGSIYKSSILIKKGLAVFIPKSVKVSKTIAKSSKHGEDITIIGPRIYPRQYVYYMNYKNLLYKFKIYNYGESKSKVSSLTFKYGKYKQTVKVKALKPGKSSIVKIIIPKSFKKSKKKVITTYINGAGKKSTSKPWNIK